MIVDVEILNNILYKLFAVELLNQNIGYEANIKNIERMMDIINAIDYIKRSRPEDEEILKIIQYYEEF